MSADKIDYKAEANNALAVVSALALPQDEGYLKRELLTMAQVHATLYAAEQQRVANLIALLQLPDGDVCDFGTRGVVWTQVSAEIVDELGLG